MLHKVLDNFIFGVAFGMGFTVAGNVLTSLYRVFYTLTKHISKTFNVIDKEKKYGKRLPTQR